MVQFYPPKIRGAKILKNTIINNDSILFFQIFLSSKLDSKSFLHCQRLNQWKWFRTISPLKNKQNKGQSKALLSLILILLSIMIQYYFFKFFFPQNWIAFLHCQRLNQWKWFRTILPLKNKQNKRQSKALLSLILILLSITIQYYFLQIFLSSKLNSIFTLPTSEPMKMVQNDFTPQK